MVEQSYSSSAATVMKRTVKMNNGREIPVVGFGCYQIRDTSDPFYWALKHGYRHLDSAVFYGNEEMIGREVKRAYKDFGLKREDLFITTKVPPSHQGYEKAKAIIQKSLQNFDLDYIDLVLIHFPGTTGLKHHDPKNIENRHGTWKALEEFVDSGLVKSIGVSNFKPQHLEDIMKVARIKPVINQFELHPMYVEYDTIEACRKYNILVECYSPFAQFHEKLVKNDVLKKVADKHGIDVARVILLFLLSKGFIVLPKSAHEERIAQNIKLEGLALTEQDIQEIDELGKSYTMKVCWDSKDVV